MCRINMNQQRYIYYFIVLVIFISFAVLVLFSNSFYSRWKIIEKMDISTQSTSVCVMQSPLWLVSYADGDDVHFSNQRTLAVSSLSNCVDFIKNYNKKHLDKAFIDKNRSILEQKRGAGYWLWKPYIILRTLNEVPENDIVVYVDSGVIIKEKLDGLASLLSDEDIIIFENVHSNRKYIKRGLLKIMNMDNENVRNSMQLQAGYIVIRNTEFSREFIKKWLEVSTNEKAITDSPSIDEHDDFVDHRYDQAILSLLYLKFPKHIRILSMDQVSYYFFNHRRRSISDGSLFLRGKT